MRVTQITPEFFFQVLDSPVASLILLNRVGCDESVLISSEGALPFFGILQYSDTVDSTVV